MRSDVLKRLFDLVVASIAILLLSPLIAVTGLLVAAVIGWPAVFVQARPGLRGKVFKMYKFRSMTNELGLDGKLLPDERRLTRFGRLLRSSSLDELPELFNVLRGEMSLVGPRPLLVEYLPLYSASQARRHEVRPGITGWAQIHGRNSISWGEKLALDVWYVEHWTIALDVKILLQTVIKAIAREGIAASGQATMTKFTGADEP